MPELACTEVSRTALIVPTNQAAAETVMNSTIFVRRAGTPTLRAAGLSPPTANVQLPNRVRSSTHDPTAVISNHQRIAIWNETPPIETVLAKIRFAAPYPVVCSIAPTWTVSVTTLVTPRLSPCSMR